MQDLLPVGVVDGPRDLLDVPRRLVGSAAGGGRSPRRGSGPGCTASCRRGGRRPGRRRRPARCGRARAAPRAATRGGTATAPASRRAGSTGSPSAPRSAGTRGRRRGRRCPSPPRRSGRAPRKGRPASRRRRRGRPGRARGTGAGSRTPRGFRLPAVAARVRPSVARRAARPSATRGARTRPGPPRSGVPCRRASRPRTGCRSRRSPAASRRASPRAWSWPHGWVASLVTAATSPPLPGCHPSIPATTPGRGRTPGPPPLPRGCG